MAIGEKQATASVVPLCDDSMTVEQILAARRRRFTVDEYYKMAEAGILSEDERVELIDGEILVKSDRSYLIDGDNITVSPAGSRHASCVAQLSELLTPAIVPRAIVRVQSPVRLNQRSEPEPDIALLRPRADFYRDAHPGPAEIFTVIEVMVSSASTDRRVKLGLYARSKVAEVWLVDLNRELIEVYRRPEGGVYTETLNLPRGQSVAPEAFPDVVLAVDAILG